VFNYIMTKKKDIELKDKKHDKKDKKDKKEKKNVKITRSIVSKNANKSNINIVIHNADKKSRKSSNRQPQQRQQAGGSNISFSPSVNMSSQQPAPNYDNYTRNYNARPEQQYSNPLIQQTQPLSVSIPSIPQNISNDLIKNIKPQSKITPKPLTQKVLTKPLFSQSPYDSLTGVNELLASLPSVPNRDYDSLTGSNELLASLPPVPNRDYDSLTGINEYIATLPPVPPSKRAITQFLNQNPIPNIITPNLEPLSDNQLLASVTQKPPPPPQKITKEEKAILQQTASVPIPNVVIPSLQPLPDESRRRPAPIMNDLLSQIKEGKKTQKNTGQEIIKPPKILTPFEQAIADRSKFIRPLEADDDAEPGEWETEDENPKVQTTDTSKKEKEKVDEPLTASQILAADKKKFEVLNNKDEKIRTPAETFKHNELRKSILVANAINKYGSIDKGISEISALLDSISAKVVNEKVAGADKINFNKLLTILNMKTVSPTFTNDYAKRIIAENLSLIKTSFNKLEEIDKATKPPPPSKPKPIFGSTVQSIQSNDTSPIDYPIDISSNVSR
jgi:hypothetical protein